MSVPNNHDQLQQLAAAASKRMQEIASSFTGMNDLGTRQGFSPGWWLSKAYEDGVQQVPALVEEIARLRAAHPDAYAEYETLLDVANSWKSVRAAEELAALSVDGYGAVTI